MSAGRALVLDSRDSFVFNLVDELRTGGTSVTTLRSGISLRDLERALDDLDPHLVVLSPGPGRPEDAGVLVEWLRTEPRVPVLGICLGHQALAVAAGGRVSRAPRPVHGRASRIELCVEDPLFAGLGGSLTVGRYHSLVVSDVPDEMSVIATVASERKTLVMGLRHRRLPQTGFQFHPESILTPSGRRLIGRAFEEARRHREDPSS